MPKYIISAGCSFSDTFNTDFKLYNDFVAEYLDAELISLGIIVDLKIGSGVTTFFG